MLKTTKHAAKESQECEPHKPDRGVETRIAAKYKKNSARMSRRAKSTKKLLQQKRTQTQFFYLMQTHTNSFIWICIDRIVVNT